MFFQENNSLFNSSVSVTTMAGRVSLFLRARLPLEVCLVLLRLALTLGGELVTEKNANAIYFYLRLRPPIPLPRGAKVGESESSKYWY